MVRTLLLFISLTLVAQYSTAQTADDLLQQVEQEFSQLSTASYEFKLTIEIPEQSDIVQTGKLDKKDDKVSATIGDRWIKSDGTSQWVYDPELNEVQIYNASESNALPISPESLTDLYKDGSFEYAITGRGEVNGIQAVFIEFKPTDNMSEYTKMRFALKEADSTPIYFKVFSRDASRYTLEITSIDTNPTLDDQLFKFNASKHPDIKVEDLRL